MLFTGQDNVTLKAVADSSEDTCTNCISGNGYENKVDFYHVPEIIFISYWFVIHSLLTRIWIDIPSLWYSSCMSIQCRLCFLLNTNKIRVFAQVICFKLFNRIEQCENNILIGSNLTSGYRSGQRITKPGEFAHIYLFIHS